MIRMEPINNNEQHFLVTADEPCRIEVSVVDGRVIMFAYRGVEVDQDQEPATHYDGTVAHEMIAPVQDMDLREEEEFRGQ